MFKYLLIGGMLPATFLKLVDGIISPKFSHLKDKRQLPGIVTFIENSNYLQHLSCIIKET